MAYCDEHIRLFGIAHQFEVATAGHVQDGSFGSLVDVKEIIYGVGDEIHSDDSYNHEVGGNVNKFTISRAKPYSWKEMLTMLS